MADRSKVTASIACLAALLAFGGGATAGEVVDLYQARTIVTGQGEARTSALAARSASQRHLPEAQHVSRCRALW